MTKQLKAVLDHIVVKRDDKEERTKGGLVLPDTAQDKPQRGVVVDVGPGRWLESGETVGPCYGEASELEKGDAVWFRKFMGTEIELGGAKYLVLTSGDILAVEIDDAD